MHDPTGDYRTRWGCDKNNERMKLFLKNIQKEREITKKKSAFSFLFRHFVLWCSTKIFLYTTASIYSQYDARVPYLAQEFLFLSYSKRHTWLDSWNHIKYFQQSDRTKRSLESAKYSRIFLGNRRQPAEKPVSGAKNILYVFPKLKKNYSKARRNYSKIREYIG